MLRDNARPYTQNHLKLGLRIDHLWMIALLSGFAVIVSLGAVYPNDFWWHLKIGQMIYETGSVPSTNMFAWTLHADHPFVYGAWLSEYLFYLVYQLGKLELVIFVRTLLVLITYAVIGYEAYRRSGSWRIATFALTFATIMGANNLIVRPQAWALLPFALYVILLSRFVENRLRREWLFLLPVLMMFWVNVHGSFVLGEVMLVIYIFGEVLGRWVRFERMLAWKDILWLGLIAVLNLGAMIVNPRNIQIFDYVVNMMTDKPSQSLIVEWQSPKPNDAAMIVFFASILALLIVFAYGRYRPRPTQMLLIVAFLWLAWTGQRYVIWYGMLSMLVMSEALGEALKGKSFLAVQPANFLNQVLAFVFVFLVLIVQPWFVGNLPLPERYRKNFIYVPTVGPLLHRTTPVEAAEYLKQNPGGKMFNHMGYGSYLIWAVPEQRVFADTRVELYPYQLWLDYIAISAGNQYNARLQKYGADRLLIDKEDQEKLSNRLRFDPTWELEYEDQYAEIWSIKTDR